MAEQRNPTEDAIRLAIVQQRRTAAEAMAARQHHRPGRIHLGLVIISGALAMALWLVLAFSLGSHASDPATYAHAVLVSFAAIPAVACVLLAATYVGRHRTADQHDELLGAVDVLRIQLVGHGDGNNLDSVSEDAVRRINMRLLNGEKNSS